jgi:hypothetical protein
VQQISLRFTFLDGLTRHMACSDGRAGSGSRFHVALWPE